MNIKWLIEKDVWHPKEEAEIIAACNKFGFEYKLSSWLPFVQDQNLKQYFSETECVIASGSIGFSTAVTRDTVWVPGTYATYKNYACSKYYPIVGDLMLFGECVLLNSEYVFVPFGDLNRLRNMLYRIFGKDDCIFIRPDSGKKLFKGKLVRFEQWKEEIEECKLWGVGQEDMVLVSSPKKIDMEWRFFVSDKKVFTGCLYKSEGLLKEDVELNKLAESLAQKTAELYQPDRCFSIDICKTGNEFKVLEINAGTSAGMYDCDIEKIVAEFSRVAWDDYKKYHDDLTPT